MEISFKCHIKPSVQLKKYGLYLLYNTNYFVNSSNRLILEGLETPIVFDDKLFERLEHNETKFDAGDIVLYKDKNSIFPKDTIFKIEYEYEGGMTFRIEDMLHGGDTKAFISDIKHVLYYWYIDDRGNIQKAIAGIDDEADRYRKKSCNYFDDFKDAEEKLNKL